MKFNGGAWNSRQPDGVLTMVGEWATQEGSPTPDLNAALADAAFVMGLEKNADVVPMECYAPLLVNVNPADPAKGYPKASQWPPNLIGYDATDGFDSASYYVQVLPGQCNGDVLPAVARHCSLAVTSLSSAAPPRQRRRRHLPSFNILRSADEPHMPLTLEPERVSDSVPRRVRKSHRFCLGGATLPDVPLAVVGGGRESCPAGCSICRDGSPHYSLEFVSRGRGWLTSDGKRHRLDAGTVFSH